MIDRLLLVFCLLLVFFLPLIFGGKELVWNAFTLPKTLFFQIFILTLTLLGVLRFFLSSRIRVIGHKYLYAFLFLLLFSLFSSSFLALNLDLSIWGRYDRMQGLVGFLGYMLVFLIVLFFVKKDWIKKILWAMVLSSGFVSIYGLIQYAGFDPIAWTESVSYPGGRIISTLGQPNFLAHFLIMVMPINIFLFFSAKKRPVKVFLASLFIVQFLSLVFTFSRAGWLSLLIGLIISFLAIFYLCQWKKIFKASAVLVVIVVFLFFGLALGGPSAFSKIEVPGDGHFADRISNMLTLDQGSAKIRINYWQAAWQEFRDASVKRKVFGYGPDSLADVFAKHYQKDWGVYEYLNNYPNRAHNFFFDTLLSFGLFGLLAFFLFIGFILLKTVRYLYIYKEDKSQDYWLVFTLGITCLLYIVNNFFSFSTVTTYVYFYLILGLLVLLVFEKHREKELKLPVLSRIIVFVSLLVFSFVFIFYYNLDFLRADLKFMEAKKTIIDTQKNQRGRCISVVDNIDMAVLYNPVHDFYRKNYLKYSMDCLSVFPFSQDMLIDNMLAEIGSLSQEKRSYDFNFYVARTYFLLSERDESYYQKSRDLYKEMIAFNPYFTTPYKELAELEARYGDKELALEMIEKGLKNIPDIETPGLSQRSVRRIRFELIDFYELYARVQQSLGKESEALTLYEKIISLNPEKTSTLKDISQIYERKGEGDRAVKHLNRVLEIDPENTQALELLERMD